MKYTYFLNFLILCALILVCNNFLGQADGENLVPNSSFENGNNNKPDDEGQVNKCDNWSKQVNSPDWFKEADGLFQSNFLDAHTGIGYIGFSSCEGAKVKLDQEIEHMNYVVISFWFSPETVTNTDILVSLTRGNPNSDGNYECSEDGPLFQTDI